MSRPRVLGQGSRVSELTEEEVLLTATSVGDYLLSRGLADPGVPVHAVELGGGVSNVVLAVTAGRLQAVVKQSLSKLRVADDWCAKKERVITEGNALKLAGRLCPGSVPQVLDIDPERGAIVIDRAPDSWRNYKEMLLAGDAEVSVAARCGEILAVWHSGTWTSDEVRESFDDLEAFDQLRVDPYHRTAAERLPELKGSIDRYVSSMSGNRKALVHGDYSPKNVLCGTNEQWIVDFEVAHYGDPAFDLAFMLNHLMLKAVHRPEFMEGYLGCSRGFLDAYRRGLIPGDPPQEDYVLGHIACLMVARVVGKSPAEYLTQAGKRRALTLGESLLRDPPHDLGEAWRRLGRVVSK